MVVSNNETKVAQYGQWDHYPSGQGVTALKIITKIIEDGKLEDFRKKVNDLRWLTNDEINELKENRVDFEESEEYLYLDRDWGAQILEAVMYETLTRDKSYMQPEKRVYPVKILGLINKESFAADSLFCEWAYVIDLDKMTFEVYKGFNRQPLPETDRFHYLDVAIKPTDLDYFEDSKTGEKYHYRAIKMVKMYDLNDLPTVSVFLNELEPRDKDEEDN